MKNLNILVLFVAYIQILTGLIPLLDSLYFTQTNNLIIALFPLQSQ